MGLAERLRVVIGKGRCSVVIKTEHTIDSFYGTCTFCLTRTVSIKLMNCFLVAVSLRLVVPKFEQVVTYAYCQCVWIRAGLDPIPRVDFFCVKCINNARLSNITHSPMRLVVCLK